VPLPTWYYSTQPFLAWVLNHYAHGGTHYAFVAPFLPYRLPNPSTSNPHKLFARFYEAWKDEDENDPTVAQNRLGLRKGIMLNAALQGEWETRLKAACDKASVNYFCPVVYRVNVADIPERRRAVEGSGRHGSDEYLIEDLREDEFDVLFFDYHDDDLLRELYDGSCDDASDALPLIETSYARR
jgi:hypothetical protein